MAVVIVREIDPGIDDLLVTHEMKHTLADDGRSVIDTQQPPLDHGGDDHAGDLIKSDLGLIEHLRDDDHGIVAGCPDPEGKVTRLTTHGAHHKPVSAGPGILINGGAEPHTFLFG